MPEYLFRGRLELSGVIFTVVAENEADAKDKAKAGRYEEWDIAGAEGVNWKLDLSSIELNE
jgi:hypothetical protein